MASDCVSREAVLALQTDLHFENIEQLKYWRCRHISPEAVELLPAVDVVSRDCYDRVLAENDTLRKQLEQIGKKPGDTMDDVRPVVLCRDCHWWTKQEQSLQGRCELAGFYPTGEWFCANGERSDMRDPNLDATKGETPLQKETAMSKYRVRYLDD